MTRTVHYFRKDGKEKLVADYYCGRFLGMIPLVQFQSDEDYIPVIGSVRRQHTGHGCYQNYLVVDMDDNTMLLQETD